MKTKHTAGKWKVKQEPFNLLVTHEIDGVENSICQISVRNKEPHEIEANAQLIAHAPELLQMVYDLMKCVKRLTEDEDADKTLEAQWIGEAHELLHNINSEYYKNANA